MFRAEVALGRFSLVSPEAEDTNVPWILNKNQLKLAQERVKKLNVPSHYDFNSRNLFTNLSHLKSHDWKQVYVLCTNSYEIKVNGLVYICYNMGVQI